MDNNIVQELTQKISDSHTCIAFIFTKEGYTQTFINGESHNLMATIANEMVKDPKVSMVIEGAYSLVQERKKQS
jgi:hypothetical protein